MRMMFLMSMMAADDNGIDAMLMMSTVVVDNAVDGVFVLLII